MDSLQWKIHENTIETDDLGVRPFQETFIEKYKLTILYCGLPYFTVLYGTLPYLT